MKRAALSIARQTIVVALVYLVAILVPLALAYHFSYSPGACYVTTSDQTFGGLCLDFDAWGWLLGGAA